MKRYLVTGGTGFIGSALVKRLIKMGSEVRVLDNQSRGKINRLVEHKKDFEFINGDIRDISRVKKAAKNIDCIIHLAFINGTENFYNKPGLVLEVGVKGMMNVLDAAKFHSIPELMLASSSEVYQTPPAIPTPEDVPYHIPTPYNPRYSYAGGKIISELMTLYMGKEFLERVIIFRPHNVYGPDMGSEHVIPQIFNKIITSKSKPSEVIIQGDGSETRAFVYIDDFITGVMLLDKKGRNGEIYNIGTIDEISIKELVTKIGNILGKKITITQSERMKGSVTRRCPSISKIAKLGYHPKVGIDEGLRKTFLWYNTSS